MYEYRTCDAATQVRVLEPYEQRIVQDRTSTDSTVSVRFMKHWYEYCTSIGATVPVRVLCSKQTLLPYEYEYVRVLRLYCTYYGTRTSARTVACAVAGGRYRTVGSTRRGRYRNHSAIKNCGTVQYCTVRYSSGISAPCTCCTSMSSSTVLVRCTGAAFEGYAHTHTHTNTHEQFGIKNLKW